MRRVKQEIKDKSVIEKILASFGLVAETPSNVYGIFNNAEMPYQKIVLSDGENVELSRVY